ncbi:TorD/DmsD family molecular chaperone [Vibrio maerlii]|uniref:TorD/DmsD family molecular chaperone n=1 Tax=Vibrio maerlii TaxID=2231648 RepID=UPI000E3B5DF5|nr:molecular chaperone [Vibrio maerlii]
MIIDSAKLIGALFYQKCTKADLFELTSALIDENILTKDTLDSISSLDDEQLEQDFSILFEGIGDMPVPPWGSVYLDRERVLFGSSAVEYRHFLQRNGVELDTGLREPEDQFGLMLLAFAYLMEQGKNEQATELLEQHLFPWAPVYLNQLINKSPNLFYKNLANNILAWIERLISEQMLNVVEKKIYLNDGID